MVGAKTQRVVCACLASLAAGAVLAEDPRGWLERMEHALATRNYQGTFVHEQNGQTETLRVMHRVSNGEIAERIVSLDGSGREFIRSNGELRAYFPDRRMVLVEACPEERLLLTELQRLDDAAARLYRLSEQPTTRVSGRTAHVIAVEPVDDLRYGYRVWIDEASAMPLKTQLRTAAGDILEQLVFTELTLPVHMADSALQPAMDTRDYHWLRHDAMATAASTAEPGAAMTWQATQLPNGFHLAGNSTQVLPGASTAVTHLVFSDGLASVSVFVEPAPEPSYARREAGSPEPPTITNVGASAALSTVVDGHKVTAIGEVPADTVRAIAGSLRAARPGGFGQPAMGIPSLAAGASRVRH
jgi:sigma-E factor negative regulatory protein RseB